jgi:post-segregation antitoxin (ccd killing protein)
MMRRRANARKRVLSQAAKRWLAANRGAIASINRFIAERGLLASKLRFRPERPSTPIKK